MYGTVITKSLFIIMYLFHLPNLYQISKLLLDYNPVHILGIISAGGIMPHVGGNFVRLK